MTSDTAARAPDDAAARTSLLERPASRAADAHRRGRGLRGRPELYTAYVQDMGLLNTPGKRFGVGLVVAAALAGAFVLTQSWLTILASAFVFAIGAIGLNIVTGMAGQVSLGHAFFVGLGAYTGAVISGPVDGPELGYGFELLPVWLLASGLVAALAGLLVAPLALRLRGLYLAIVTLGLVFLGEHLFKELDFVTGGPNVGREAAIPGFFGFRFDESGEVLGMMLTNFQRSYLLMLAMLVVFAILARNLARSDLGRAFAAVRDRDIAAEVIGVNLTRVKVLAFVISSFYAGIAGGLLYTIEGFLVPEQFGLFLSVEFIAMILIGGIATVSGAIMGALFLSTLGRFSQELVALLPAAIELRPALLQGILYGLLIIGFLILEPRGLFGIWIRIRNYWKGWPFSY